MGVVGGLILLLVICLIAMRKKVRSVIFGSPVTVDTGNEEWHGYSAESGLLMQGQQHFIMSLDALAEATQNFHENNKLGEGGFGSVYRGTTRDGKEIAVKKLSARSTQDPEKRRQLNWQQRYNIAIGIARGLLYLHEDSQMKIIHRDIKANNILLDDKLNAKIADFGLARLFLEDETQIQTRVAGTYGYMAPEYAMRGQLSVKADVYSFGVLVLEIVSGRKNTDLNLPHEMQNLLEWAWRLYRGGDVISMVESNVRESWPKESVERCIHVALLCVQADATVRPAMSNVIMMISTNAFALPNPTKPAFLSASASSEEIGLEKREKGTPTFTESQSSGTTASSTSGVPSVNQTSITDVGPR
ncbi:cysteine-rich receptor-like protein kinase 7 [Cryptomeria japonica]|uniref:cysteine-rich receptor-like protein kinase 7 n=1 Tax=Cryptomeria japonica TaxID=3369 RepID=UPI0025AB98CB|nr:cysteine-rich receptor-like protein kinase 7 [Cryptomeria japonica]